MGLDCAIRFKVKNGKHLNISELEECLSETRKIEVIKLTDRDINSGNSYDVVTPFRYWSQDYPGGPWPLISLILMTLLGNDSIETVWYDGDYINDDEKDDPFTLEMLLEYTKHYVEINKRLTNIVTKKS